jgi:hypothetical protein
MTPYEEDTRKIQAENAFREAQGLTLDRQGILTQTRAMEEILSRIRRPVLAKMDETSRAIVAMRLGYIGHDVEAIRKELNKVLPPDWQV